MVLLAYIGKVVWQFWRKFQTKYCFMNMFLARCYLVFGWAEVKHCSFVNKILKRICTKYLLFDVYEEENAIWDLPQPWLWYSTEKINKYFLLINVNKKLWTLIFSLLKSLQFLLIKNYCIFDNVIIKTRLLCTNSKIGKKMYLTNKYLLRFEYKNPLIYSAFFRTCFALNK